MSDRPNWERPLIEQMANIYITQIGELQEEIEKLQMKCDKLHAALADVLASKLAEECQECGIGQTPQWKAAKALLVI